MRLEKLAQLLQSFPGSSDTTETSMGLLDQLYGEQGSIEALKTIQGIRNIQNIANPTDQVVGYKYAFDNLEALNTALVLAGSELALIGLGESPVQNNRIDWEGKHFKRTMYFPQTELDPNEKASEPNILPLLMADAKYRIEYHFDQGVRKVKGNPLAVRAASKKQVTLELPLSDLLNHKAAVDVELKLRNPSSK
jgi:hypothetical protein